MDNKDSDNGDIPYAAVLVHTADGDSCGLSKLSADKMQT
jgi:hypothetical protein